MPSSYLTTQYKDQNNNTQKTVTKNNNKPNKKPPKTNKKPNKYRAYF